MAPNALLQLAGLPLASYTGAFFAADIEVFAGVQVSSSGFTCTVP